MKTLTSILILAAALHCALSVSIGYAGQKKKMVCYYGSWAVYRPGNGRFDVENIDPFVCTHLVFGFAGLQSYDSSIIALDPYNELYENWGKGAYERFNALKKINPELKTILAIGGWNEGSEKYSQMVTDPAKRAKFTSSVVDFLRRYGFDGLDFDWEYPGSRGGVTIDKVNFVNMIRELKAAFAPYGLLLTMAASAGKSTIDAGYDISEISANLDQVHLMAYDFHGAWDPYTGHNSPLYANPNIESGDTLFLNVNYSVNYWIANGVNPSKLILGMPLYGRGNVLSNSANNGFYAPAPNPLPAGPYVREDGNWGYNEICEKFSRETGWTIVRDPYYQAPYAYKGNLWISYDDQESLRAKALYAASMNLGGAMVWSIETDDFRGSCHGTPFILIKTIYETMNGPIVKPTVPTINPSQPTYIPTAPTAVPTQTTKRPSDVTTTTGKTPGTPAPNPICKGEGLFADPTDCSIFYQCINNGMGGWSVYTHRCATGTVFDQSINGCNYPSNVPGCNNYSG